MGLREPCPFQTFAQIGHFPILALIFVTKEMKILKGNIRTTELINLQSAKT